MSQELRTHGNSQAFRGASPWSRRELVLLLLWESTWALFCAWTPKPLSAWRLIVLKIFGGTIVGKPFVHQRARIQIPWNIELHDRACVGDRSNLYSLDRIVIGEGSIVAQEAYLCTGTHDLSVPSFPLQTAPIIVGKNAFIGARAFLLPGIYIGDGAVVGACSVVTRDVPAGQVVIVIGPSGSGKSTLCRTINRLESIDSGNIEILSIVVKLLLRSVDTLRRLRRGNRGRSHRSATAFTPAITARFSSGFCYRR